MAPGKIRPMPPKALPPTHSPDLLQPEIPGSAKDNVERLRMLWLRWQQVDLAAGVVSATVRFEPARGGALWDLFVGGEKVNPKPGAPLALLNDAVADLARKLTLRFRSDGAALQLCGYPTEAFDAPGEEVRVGVDPAVQAAQAPLGWLARGSDGAVYAASSAYERGGRTGVLAKAARWRHRTGAEQRAARFSDGGESWEVVSAPRREYVYGFEEDLSSRVSPSTRSRPSTPRGET